MKTELNDLTKAVHERKLQKLTEKGVQIISKDVKIETKRAGWTAHGELLLREAAVSLVDSRAEDTGAEDLDRNED